MTIPLATVALFGFQKVCGAQENVSPLASVVPEGLKKSLRGEGEDYFTYLRGLAPLKIELAGHRKGNLRLSRGHKPMQAGFRGEGDGAPF